jgi:putative ABC transport system permease protein
MSRDNPRRAPGLFTLIRRDVRRRAFRTIASAGTVAVVVGALFVTMLLTSGAAYSTQLTRDKLGADIMILPKGATVSPTPFYTLLYTPGPNYMSQGYLQAVASISGVKETAAQLYLTHIIHVGGGGYGARFWVVAVDPSNFMLGSWLSQNVSRPLREGEAVLGWQFPRLYDIPNNGVWYGTKLTPIFRLPRTGTFMDNVMFVSLDTARGMLEWQMKGIDPGPCCDWLIPLSFSEGQVSAVFVKVNNGVDPDQVAKQIDSTYQFAHAITVNSLVGSANNRMGEFLSTSSVSSSLVLVASVLLVSAVTSATTNERSQEFGLMRALGGTRRFIGKLVAAQTILVTSLSGLFGIVGAWILFNIFYATIISTLGIPHQIPPPDQLTGRVGIAMASAVAIGVIAAIWPVVRVTRLDPYDVAKKTSR